MPQTITLPENATTKHSLLEDAQGLSIGVFICSFGLYVLTTAGLVTGQIAGLAAIISYLSGWSFGAVFFVVNLPFYALGYRRFGLSFTLKSFAAVTAMSILTDLIPLGLGIDQLHPGLAAVIFGVLVGLGVLAVFRHGASLGGVGVLALVVQDRFGIRAGYVQLGFDAGLFALAVWLFPLSIVGWSLLGAVILNLIIAINHRRDRYIGET
ncbi:MAG: YitT family protein [Pseudomonadota bacterium]